MGSRCGHDVVATWSCRGRAMVTLWSRRGHAVVTTWSCGHWWLGVTRPGALDGRGGLAPGMIPGGAGRLAPVAPVARPPPPPPPPRRQVRSRLCPLGRICALRCWLVSPGWASFQGHLPNHSGTGHVFFGSHEIGCESGFLGVIWMRRLKEIGRSPPIVGS